MSLPIFDSLHRGLGSVLDLRQAQHALTAGNLANVDTPGYRARVIPFDRLLSEVMGDEDHLAMGRTRDSHMSGNGSLGMEIDEIEPPPWALDGNSVVSEREVARLAENSLMYRSISQGVSRRLAMLRYAASNGR